MNKSTPNQLLVEFEQKTELTAAGAAHVLGLAYPTYAAYRSGRRELPQYNVNQINQINLIAALSERAMIKYIEERLNAST